MSEKCTTCSAQNLFSVRSSPFNFLRLSLTRAAQLLYAFINRQTIIEIPSNEEDSVPPAKIPSGTFFHQILTMEHSCVPYGAAAYWVSPPSLS